MAVVVEFDADRGGVDVGDRPPAPGARVPRARIVVDQLVDAAVRADQIVRADGAFAVAIAQRVEALRYRMLLGEVDDDQHRPARAEVVRGHPGRERIVGGLCRAPGQAGEGQQQEELAESSTAVRALVNGPIANGSVANESICPDPGRQEAGDRGPLRVRRIQAAVLRWAPKRHETRPIPLTRRCPRSTAAD